MGRTYHAGPGSEGVPDWGWHIEQIQAAERNADVYRKSRKVHSKSWHWIDVVSTFVPTATAGVLLLLTLFWVVRLFVG